MITEWLFWLFPSWQLVLFALAWVGFAIVASLLSNHQELRNKRLNILKVIAFATFLISWANLSNFYRGATQLSWGAIVLGYSGTFLYLLGDWIAFLIHSGMQTPGGVRGIFWRWVIARAEALRSMAVEEARQSLSPHETKIMALEHKERDQIIVSSPVPLTVSRVNAVDPEEQPPSEPEGSKPELAST